MSAPAGPEHLGELIEAASAQWPDRVAWRFGADDVLTFRDVDRITGHVALALRAAGVRPGDAVGLMARNTVAFPSTWLAIARLGAATVPINVGYRTSDAAHVVELAHVAFLVVADEFHALAEQVIDTTGGTTILLRCEDLLAGRESAPSDAPATFEPVDGGMTCNIQFTSGTTGLPKGCVLGHDYWLAIAATLCEQFPGLTDRDVMLTAQPFHYIDPQWNVVSALRAGAELVILDAFHPSTFWSDVRRFDVTYFYCLGVMPTLLLKMPVDPRERDHRVRAVQCSAIPPDLHADLEARWGVPWFEAYGMTETGADLFVGLEEHDELVGTGCLGRPRSHRSARVVDSSHDPVGPGITGELLLRGPGMMKGYFADPPATCSAMLDGWFRTGDLVRTDDDGRVYFVGRTKDMIRRGGENISAVEVEQLLQRHPEVEMAAVVAVEDEVRGQEVMAYVVPTNGAATAGLGQRLARWAADEVAGFKIPRYWQMVPDLPRTASERVAKSGLSRSPDDAWDLRAGGRV